MKIIPLFENKIKIEFDDGETIEIYESPNWHVITLEEGKKLDEWIGKNTYKIVPAEGGGMD